MLKTIFFIVFFAAAQFAVLAQNYTFDPSNEYYGTLEMDMYTEHYMYIGHDLPDSAYITWRLVENTCPTEWDIQACDYQHCYTGLPNYGNMNGVAAGAQGYLRMIVNPFLTPGVGMLHFLIYPTGEPLNYTDAYYFLNTTVTHLIGAADQIEQVTVASNEIVYSGASAGVLKVFDVSGKCMLVTTIGAHSSHISIDTLPSGIYLLSTPSGNTFKICKSN